MSWERIVGNDLDVGLLTVPYLGIGEPERTLLSRLVAVYGPLRLRYVQHEGEDIYSIHVISPISILRGNALWGPGTARSTMAEAVRTMAEAFDKYYAGCQIYEPLDGQTGVYGPITDNKMHLLKPFDPQRAETSVQHGTNDHPVERAETPVQRETNKPTEDAS